MESGGIFRTIIITALFLVLVCDYTTLITQLYQSMTGNDSSRRTTFVEEDDGRLDIAIQAPSWEGDIDLDASLDADDLNLFGRRTKTEVQSIVRNVCLPKLICELTSGANDRPMKPNEQALLKLISETTLGTYAEVPSIYHFAAHMGQLIAGTDIGCHVFYSTCPLPGKEVLKMLKELKP